MIYNKDITTRVCDLIAEGYSLRAIDKMKGLPAKATILRWLKDPRKIKFKDAYREAKEVQRIIYADYVVDLAQRYGYRNLGQIGSRVHKLYLKQNDKPRKQINILCEELYRMQARLSGHDSTL